MYSPIIEKQKIVDVSERSTYQPLEQYTETGNGCPKNYGATKKANATLFKKRYQPVYLEHLAFLIKLAGWIVTRYIHIGLLNRNVLKEISY